MKKRKVFLVVVIGILTVMACSAFVLTGCEKFYTAEELDFELVDDIEVIKFCSFTGGGKLHVAEKEDEDFEYIESLLIKFFDGLELSTKVKSTAFAYYEIAAESKGGEELYFKAGPAKGTNKLFVAWEVNGKIKHFSANNVEYLDSFVHYFSRERVYTYLPEDIGFSLPSDIETIEFIDYSSGAASAVTYTLKKEEGDFEQVEAMLANFVDGLELTTDVTTVAHVCYDITITSKDGEELCFSAGPSKGVDQFYLLWETDENVEYFGVNNMEYLASFIKYFSKK